MHILFGILGAAFVIAGFVGFVGGVFAIIFWVLAAICFALAVKFYPRGKKGPNGPVTKRPE